MIYKSSQLDKPVCEDLYKMIHLMGKINLYSSNQNRVIIVLKEIRDIRYGQHINQITSTCNES
jgi:hypothetical protein